jgi:hypothetical protein
MSIQPIKNEQAVMQMASNQATQPKASPMNLQSPQIQPTLSGPDNVAGDKVSTYASRSKAAPTKDVLSGATIAPAKEAVGRLAALENSKETTALHVQTVRASKVVEEQLETAKEKMNEIVDSYPPFLRGSEKRQQYLMSISSIRQQIEAMTLPPNKLDNPNLDVASSKEAKDMWANLFTDIGVPKLEYNGPNEASDAQIREASSAVGKMISGLAGRRSALEQQLAPSAAVAEQFAVPLSQSTGQGLAATKLPLTNNFSEALKGL